MRIAHNLLIKLSLFISSSFAVFLFFAGKDIIEVWTQGKIIFHPVLWILLLIYLPLNCLWQTSAIFQIAINKHKKYALLRISSAVLGIILAIILTKIWGVVGTLLGFIIAELIICGWFVPAETLKIINFGKMNFWSNTVGKGFIIISSQIFVAWFLFNYISNIFLQWGLLIPGIFLVGMVVGYLFWLTEEEKNKALQLIKFFK